MTETWWIEVNAHGRILQKTGGEAPRAAFGGTVHEVFTQPDPARQMYVDGALLDIGERPSWKHRIDPVARAWVLTLTDDEKIDAVRVRLQGVMDAAARALGYDDVKSAIGYRGDPNPKYAAEAEAFFTWRSAVWTDCYAHPAMSGLAPIPTPDEAEALMPSLEFPGA